MICQHEANLNLSKLKTIIYGQIWNYLPFFWYPHSNFINFKGFALWGQKIRSDLACSSCIERLNGYIYAVEFEQYVWGKVVSPVIPPSGVLSSFSQIYVSLFV